MTILEYGKHRWRGHGIRKNMLRIVLFVLVFLCFQTVGCGEPLRMSEGEFQLLEEPNRAENPQLAENAQKAGNAQQAGDSQDSQLTICVHVCGAVRQPGVVTIPAGSRICDALEAAGGYSEDADKSIVNLAAFVQDGQQVVFPTMEEAAAMETTADGLIDLNTADEELLCTLPGIGSSKAKAIVKYRTQKGRFESAEELMEIPGIKQALYDQVCDLVVVR